MTAIFLLPQATIAELLWVAFAVVAGLVSLWALRDALVDSAVLSAAKVNGARRTIADNNIRQEAIRFAVCFVMMLASFSFIFLEPPPPSYRVLPQSLVGLLAWVFVSLLLMIGTFLDRSIRKKLQRFSPLEVSVASKIVTSAQADGLQTPGDVMHAAQEVRQKDIDSALLRDRRKGD